MQLQDIFTIVFIVTGALVLGMSIVQADIILRMLRKSAFSKHWRILIFLMCFFLAGYLIITWMIAVGIKGFLVTLTGVIFLFGALFVYLVVYTGRLTIKDLIDTTVSKEALESVNDALTNAQEQARKANQLASTDSLTHLANRRMILDDLKKIAASTYRHKNYGAVLIMDLDGFKAVNDTHGHEVGDAVLIEISERLKSMQRTEDAIGRIGGDEFVILVHGLGDNEEIARKKILELAERIIRLVSEPISFNGINMQVGASIGIHLLGSENIDAETSLRKADEALYRAKKAGRGCAEIS